MSETRDTRDIVEEVKKTLQKLSLMWPFDPYHPEETAAALDTIEHVGDAIDELARLRRDTGEPVEDAELLHVVGQYIRAHLHMDSDEPNPLLVALRFGDLHDAYNVRVHGATPPAPASEATVWDETTRATLIESIEELVPPLPEGAEAYFLVIGEGRFKAIRTRRDVAGEIVDIAPCAEACRLDGVGRMVEGRWVEVGNRDALAAPAGGEREEACGCIEFDDDSRWTLGSSFAGGAHSNSAIIDGRMVPGFISLRIADDRGAVEHIFLRAPSPESTTGESAEGAVLDVPEEGGVATAAPSHPTHESAGSPTPEPDADEERESYHFLVNRLSFQMAAAYGSDVETEEGLALAHKIVRDHFRTREEHERGV